MEGAAPGSVVAVLEDGPHIAHRAHAHCEDEAETAAGEEAPIADAGPRSCQSLVSTAQIATHMVVPTMNPTPRPATKVMIASKPRLACVADSALIATTLR